MRNKIFGAIGTIWGGAILFNWLTSTGPSGSAAYQGGSTAAVFFGSVMFCVGLYYFFKKPAQT